MMLTFLCSKCSSEIMSEESFQGQRVECPICYEIQIVPETIKAPGDVFDDFIIGNIIDSNIVWNSYEAVGAPASEFADQKVMLKIPSLFLRQNLDSFDSFINIVCRNSSLNANEFPQLLERGGDSTNPFFIYKYEQTLNLREYAELNAPMEPLEALRIIRMIAHAMNGVWNKDKIVHQNLIPRNIRLTAKHGLRINEVGISQYMLSNPQLLEHGLDIWNVRYMSPEFAETGEANTPAEDIYSLGCIFFMLLTGQEPYQDIQDVETIMSLETPNPLKINQNISQPIYNIFNSMMEKNQVLRIKSWLKLIEEIDSVLDKSTQRISLSKFKPIEIKQEQLNKRSKPKGFNLQGTGTWVKVDRVQRDGTLPLQSKSKSGKDSNQNTHVRLVKDDELKVKSLTRKGKRPSAAQSKGAGSLLKDNAALIIFSVIGILAAGGIIFYTSSQKSKRQQQRAQLKKEQAAKKAQAAKEELKAAKERLKQASRKKKAIIKSAAKKSFNEMTLDEKVASVADFFSKYPDKREETIKKYEDLIDLAMKKKRFDVMDDLKDRILTLEKKKDQIISKVLKKIKDKAELLCKHKKYDEALNFLDNYNGEFKEETAMKRKIYYREIEESLTQKAQAKEKAKQDKLEQEKKIASYLATIFKQTPMQVLRMNVASPIRDFDQAIKVDEYKELTAYLKELKEQLELYEEVPDLFRQKYSKFQGRKKRFKVNGKKMTVKIRTIKNGRVYYRRRGKEYSFSCFELPTSELFNLIVADERSKMKEPVLFDGLIYLHKANIKKAGAEFAKLKYGWAPMFDKALETVAMEIKLKQILTPYGLVYDPASKASLLEAIGRKKLKESDAIQLFKQLDQLTSNVENTSFLDENQTVLKALVNLCNKNMESKQQITSSIVISADQNSKKTTQAAKSSEELSQALLKALESFGTKKKLKLEPGVYKLPSELYDFSDVNLVGQKGVIFHGRLSIYGENFKMSDIVFEDTPLYISSNSRNIQISDCIFKTEPVRIADVDKIQFDNCFFRGLKFTDSKKVKLNHCTIISPRQGSEKQAALWLNVKDAEVLNSVIYGERYGVMFSDQGKRKHKIFDNCLWFGKKGYSAQVESKGDEIGEIDRKSIVTKPLKLRKYCRIKSNFYDVPQFIAPEKDNWNLVKDSPGYKAASDGKNCGAIFE